MKIIGVAHQIGSFEQNGQSINFDNYNLYICNDQNKPGEFGLIPMRFQKNGKPRNYASVKASYLHSIVTADQIQTLVGKQVMLYFDTYGNVASLEIIK